jgi:hypothetical protein
MANVPFWNATAGEAIAPAPLWDRTLPENHPTATKLNGTPTGFFPSSPDLITPEVDPMATGTEVIPTPTEN